MLDSLLIEIEHSTLRNVWSIIEETPVNVISSFSDTDLVKYLIIQIDKHKPLSNKEASIIKTYIHSRIVLIKELAATRHCILGTI